MSWEPRPLPKVTPETEPFWTAAADGRLLLQRCEDCELTYYYPRSFCPDCFSDDVVWQEASGRGTVHSYTVTEKVGGWPKDELPLVIAYVELEEGPRMMTNVADCDPADVEIGTAVEVRFVGTDENVGIPVFTPTTD